MAFKYSDYLIMPSDIYRGVLHVRKNIRWIDIAGIVLLGAVYAYVRYYLGWQADSSLFLSFLLSIFFWNLDARIPIALALVCLVACPFLLVAYNDYGFLEGEDWAEQFAIWAYYFLVFGVLKQMWDFRREGEEENENSQEQLTDNDYIRDKECDNDKIISMSLKDNAGFSYFSDGLFSEHRENIDGAMKEKSKEAELQFRESIDLATFIKMQESSQKTQLVQDIKPVRRKRQ